MNKSFREFDARIKSVGRKHQQMEAGFRTEIDDTGLLVQKPAGKAMRKVGRFLPIRSLGLMAAIGLVYKAFLLTQLGADSYSAKVTGLMAGDSVERVGGWLMQADPVTLRIADLIGPWVG